MTEQLKYPRPPKGFHSHEAFVGAVGAAFYFAVPGFSNGYPRHGAESDKTLEYCAITLMNCYSDDPLSKDFMLPNGEINSCKQIIYDLAEFLATAKAKGHGEDDRYLKSIYDFMKSQGIPIIEYRDEVGPNAETLNDPLNADELAEWARVQAEAKGTPANRKRRLTRPWARR